MAEQRCWEEPRGEGRALVQQGIWVVLVAARLKNKSRSFGRLTPFPTHVVNGAPGLLNLRMTPHWLDKSKGREEGSDTSDRMTLYRRGWTGLGEGAVEVDVAAVDDQVLAGGMR